MNFLALIQDRWMELLVMITLTIKHLFNNYFPRLSVRLLFINLSGNSVFVAFKYFVNVCLSYFMSFTFYGFCHSSILVCVFMCVFVFQFVCVCDRLWVLVCVCVYVCVCLSNFPWIFIRE